MIPKLPKNDWRSTWIKLGLLAIVIKIIFSFQPAWCELLYSRGLFPYIRMVLDHSFGLLPFAGIYIYAILLLLFIPRIILKSIKNIIKKQNLKQSIFSFFAYLLGLIFWFLFLWGFHYDRIPIAQQINLELPSSLDEKEIWAEALFVKNICIQTRNKIPNIDSNVIGKNYYPNDLDLEMRMLLEEVLLELGYDLSGNVSGRLLSPQGFLLRFSSSGVYFPFTGEGHIDAALPAVVQPFTMAHELAHGYGFGSEATCNFLAYLACHRSQNPAIQYAGYLTYWRYVYGELKAFLPREDYQKERATISRGMYNDIENIYTTLDNYPPLIPQVQRTTYDLFLKAQGVKEGIKSYNGVVLLVASWRKKIQINI